MDSEGGQFELTVIDPENLVTDGQSLPRPDGLSDKGVELDADGRGVLVWWPGLPCEDHPVITLADGTDVVRINVDNGPRRQGVCQMNEVQFTVLVSLSKDFQSAEPAK